MRSATRSSVRALALAPALALSSLSLAACARPMLDASATAPIQPHPAVATAISGVWKGEVALGGEGALPVTLVQGAALDGTVTGRLAFVSTPTAPAEVKLLEATDSSYAAIIGPYYDAETNTDMIARIDARLRGGALEGTLTARRLDGGRVERAKLEMRKVEGTTIAARSSSLAPGASCQE